MVKLGARPLGANLAPEFLAVDINTRRCGDPELHGVPVNRDHGERQLTVRHQNPFAQLATEDEHGMFLLGLDVFAFCFRCRLTASFAHCTQSRFRAEGHSHAFFLASPVRLIATAP